MATILMTEEYWMGSQFSVARYYGGINANFGEGAHSFSIVNKNGITLLELSNPKSKHYVKEGKAIPPGEPADLVDVEFIPFYKKLGRDRFTEVLEANPTASRKALLTIYKDITKKPKTKKQ